MGTEFYGTERDDAVRFILRTDNTRFPVKV
jgi:hypothetical protein